jgi:L-cystine uptake protein TcyP (sodium:dicarboxylate symporter family)
MADAAMPAADLERVRLWLTVHGLAGDRPTSLLVTRLVVRQKARLVAAVLLAGFICVVALAYVSNQPWSLAVLTALVLALVLGQALLDWWVRRTDRRAAATLTRRVAHAVPLGWRTLLGVPLAVFVAVTFAGATAMAVNALTVPEPTARYAGVVLLIGLGGTAVSMIVQLRHALTYPAVADDQVSLAADVIIRVEDARDMTVPSVVWSLPVTSVFAAAPGWWNGAWIAFIALSAVALGLITWRTPRPGAVARQVTNAG